MNSPWRQSPRNRNYPSPRTLHENGAACCLLLLVGLFTRPVAFILSGEMAVAYFMLRPSRGFFPLLNGGEAEVFYCFAFLYLAFAGAGPSSIDHSWRRTAAAGFTK